jgi:hypothetical protein
MNRCIIIGAMSHASGGENTKLLTMTIGIQRNACCDSAGVIKTVTRPRPKTTALTITKIKAATRRRALLSLVIFGSFFASRGQLLSSVSGSQSSLTPVSLENLMIQFSTRRISRDRTQSKPLAPIWQVRSMSGWGGISEVPVAAFYDDASATPRLRNTIPLASAQPGRPLHRARSLSQKAGLKDSLD